MSFRCNAAVFAQQGGDFSSSPVDCNIERCAPVDIFCVHVRTVVEQYLHDIFFGELYGKLDKGGSVPYIGVHSIKDTNR